MGNKFFFYSKARVSALYLSLFGDDVSVDNKGGEHYEEYDCHFVLGTGRELVTSRRLSMA